MSTGVKGAVNSIVLSCFTLRWQFRLSQQLIGQYVSFPHSRIRAERGLDAFWKIEIRHV